MRAYPAAPAAAMSLGTAEPASETGDDSLSAITFDSDFETKAKRKNFHKPPPSTSPRSPYCSKPRKVTSWRSLRTAGGMPLNSRMSLTPQKLWLGAPKQGHVSGTSVYREKEDMYDEIIELKKSLHMQKSDVDLMRTKLRRLEEENNKKDRQIEQLLDPGRGPDFVRTLAEKKPDTGWVITGLKQRIFRLEQQCKEKDGTINKLQTDMKTTNLEEMRIAMETYYEEIHRLQTLLASSEATGKKPTMEKKLGVKRQKKMSGALLNLTRSVQELTEENQSLKEDLDRMLSNSPTSSKLKGYIDWSKPRLLRRIAELEKKISSSESPKPSTSEQIKSNPLIRSSSNISIHKQSKGDQPKVDQPSVDTSKGDQAKVDQPKVDQSEDQERLRGTVKSLKMERSTLRAQLLEKDVEVKQLLQAKVDLEKELEMAREGEKESREREQALKEEIETLTSKCQELEEAEKQKRDALMAAAQEAHRELCTPSPCSKHSQPDSEPDSHNSVSQEDGSRPPTPCSEERREAAARTLQNQWKTYKCKKREAALDEAAIVLQAAFRGHLARSKLLQSKARDSSSSPSLPDLPTQHSPTPCDPSAITQAEDSPAQEEAITVIQSILRGHLARAKFISSCDGTTTMASQRGAAVATYPESTSLTCLGASGKEDSEASGGESTEDEDEAEELADLQPCSGAIRVGLFAKETREATVMDATSSYPSVPYSAQGGHWSCLSPPSLEAVPHSSVKNVMCLDACEDRSSSAGNFQPSLEPSPEGLQPVSPPPVEDFNSDDSDDIIIAPFLSRKKSPSPF